MPAIEIIENMLNDLIKKMTPKQKESFDNWRSDSSHDLYDDDKNDQYYEDNAPKVMERSQELQVAVWEIVELSCESQQLKSLLSSIELVAGLFK